MDKVSKEETKIIESFIAATRSGNIVWNYDRETEIFSPNYAMRFVIISVGKDTLLLERKDTFLEISSRKVRILWALLRGIQAEKNKNDKKYILKETKEFIERTVKHNNDNKRKRK